MNDPREELGLYWPQTALPFGMTPQPTGSLPGPGWGVLPVNETLLSMWDSSKIPIPPAQAPWFPPAAPSANQPAPVAEPLDTVNYWGAAPAPTVARVPPIPSGGILGDFGQERRGILGNFGQRGDDELRTEPWAIRLPFRVPTTPIPIDSLAMPMPLKLPIAPVPIVNLLLPAQQPWDDASSYNSSPTMRNASTVSRAPAWDTVPTRSADRAPGFFQEPPAPSPWGASGRGAADYSQTDEAGMAQEAYRAAARRTERGARGRATAPYEPPARDPEADTAEPGLIDRTRLNGVDSFYRGTILGAGRLALMQPYASTPDEPGIDPQTKRWHDQLRKDYPQVLADLKRYDSMRRFENPLEFGAAAIGQLGGGLPTPESLLGVGAKGATALWRIARAGLQQGAINATTDPVVQGLNMRAGVQDRFDPWRPVIAGGSGFVTGAGTRSAAELLPKSGPRASSSGAPDAIRGEGSTELFSQRGEDELKSLATNWPKMYDPPSRPPRAFSKDYPSGATADESGRLLTDMDGRPLTAKYIAGRRTIGGKDVGLEPREIYDLIRNLIGTPPQLTSNKQLDGNLGIYLPTVDEKGRPARPEIWINRGLDDLMKQRVMTHEAGHMAEDLAVGPNGMSTKGLERELERVYSPLNSGVEERRPLFLPKDKGYSEEQSPFELVAEAFRGYLTNPNFLKTEAPNMAASIRALWNSHPQLSKWLQFNSLGGLAALQREIGGRADDRANGKRQQPDERL